MDASSYVPAPKALAVHPYLSSSVFQLFKIDGESCKRFRHSPALSGGCSCDVASGVVLYLSERKVFNVVCPTARVRYAMSPSPRAHVQVALFEENWVFDSKGIVQEQERLLLEVCVNAVVAKAAVAVLQDGAMLIALLSRRP